MVLVFKFGQIMLSMKVNGERTKLMEEASSGMLTEIFMRENGKTIKLMAMESTFMLTELSMKVTGKMISKMAKVWNHGKMVADMKVDTKKA